MEIKEVFKNFIEKFFWVALSSGITAAVPILEQFSGKWSIATAILAAILITINKWIKDEKLVYKRLTEKIRG